MRATVTLDPDTEALVRRRMLRRGVDAASSRSLT